LVESLKEIVGAEHVFDKYEDRYCYTYDASFITVGKKEVPELIV